MYEFFKGYVEVNFLKKNNCVTVSSHIPTGGSSLITVSNNFTTDKKYRQSSSLQLGAIFRPIEIKESAARDAPCPDPPPPPPPYVGRWMSGDTPIESSI